MRLASLSVIKRTYACLTIPAVKYSYLRLLRQIASSVDIIGTIRQGNNSEHTITITDLPLTPAAARELLPWIKDKLNELTGFGVLRREQKIILGTYGEAMLLSRIKEVDNAEQARRSLRPLKQKEIAAMLGCSIRQVSRLVGLGSIPREATTANIIEYQSKSKPQDESLSRRSVDSILTRYRDAVPGKRS